jgi:hypothetical protein
MSNAGQFTDLKKWGAFKVPVFGFVFVLALLTFRNVGIEIEYIYIVRFTSWALGASIISYAHSLAYSTHLTLTQAKDLPCWAQISAIAIHVVWFAFAIYVLPSPPVSALRS